MTIRLKPYSLERCHAFYKSYEPDKLMTNDPFEYSVDFVERYYYKKVLDPQRYFFAIMMDETVVGEIQLKKINVEKSQATLSIVLSNDNVKNKGIGTLAERMILTFARDVLKLQTVLADAVKRNTRSIYVLEKLGFEQTHADEEMVYYELSLETFRSKPFVYHSSKISDLEYLAPQVSTHHKAYVYATKALGTSALFLSGTGGDFTCAIGRDRLTHKIYACERFKDAFKLRYKNQQGSIYLLNPEGFEGGKTPWIEEVVSEYKAQVAMEIFIEDVYEFIQQLAKQGHLELVNYPTKIDGLPEDDSDIVEKAIGWVKEHGESVLEVVAKYHPHLLEKVQQGL